MTDYPEVDGLPIPTWDPRFYQCDCGCGVWMFRGPEGYVHSLNPRSEWAELIAHHAECCWRRRAERYGVISSNLFICLKDRAAPFYDREADTPEEAHTREQWYAADAETDQAARAAQRAIEWGKGEG